MRAITTISLSKCAVGNAQCVINTRDTAWISTESVGIHAFFLPFCCSSTLFYGNAGSSGRVKGRGCLPLPLHPSPTKKTYGFLRKLSLKWHSTPVVQTRSGHSGRGTSENKRSARSLLPVHLHGIQTYSYRRLSCLPPRGRWIGELREPRRRELHTDRTDSLSQLR